MKALNYHGYRTGSAIVLVFLAATLLPTGSAWAAGATKTNSVPYAQDFQAIGDGVSIISTSPLGWSGSDTNQAVVVTTNYSCSSYPLEDSVHTKVAKLQTDGATITNILESTDPKVWIDMNIQMVPSDAEPTSITNDSAVQMAIYLNSSNQLVVYHGMPDDTGDWINSSTNYFTVLDHDTIEMGSWHRLTVSMDYDTANSTYALDHEFFKIELDGEAISNATWAWDAPDNLEAGAGGTWFLCANSASDTNRDLNATLLSGTGYFDDFVVTNGPVNNASQFYTAGVPGAWLLANGLDDSQEAADSNDDGDIYAAYEEWLMATDPTVSNDYAVTTVSAGGTNFVSWQCSGVIDLAAPPIMVNKFTNLLDGPVSSTPYRASLVVGTNTHVDATGDDAAYGLSVTSE